MSFTDSAEGLTAMMRDFMAAVRRHATLDGPEDSVDRILAVATILITAVMVAWPDGRKLPRIAAVALNLGRQIWARRSWWITP
jgi:hypothetical protein